MSLQETIGLLQREMNDLQDKINLIRDDMATYTQVDLINDKLDTLADRQAPKALDPEIIKSLVRHIYCDDKNAAIKIVRQLTRCSLKEGKDVVEWLIEYLNDMIRKVKVE